MTNTVSGVTAWTSPSQHVAHRYHPDGPAILADDDHVPHALAQRQRRHVHHGGVGGHGQRVRSGDGGHLGLRWSRVCESSGQVALGDDRHPPAGLGTVAAIDGRTWLEHLSPTECWGLLAATPVGRIGVLSDSAPEIYPVNHIVDRDTIVLRTDPGSKLRGLLRSPAVCYEVDGIDPAEPTGW